MIYITIIDKEARSQRGLRRREGKLALILKAPAHNKLPAYKTFHIEILRLKRSRNSTEGFEAEIVTCWWWFTSLQSLEQYVFLRLFMEAEQSCWPRKFRSVYPSAPQGFCTKSKTGCWTMETRKAGICYLDKLLQAIPPNTRRTKRLSSAHSVASHAHHATLLKFWSVLICDQCNQTNHGQLRPRRM